MATPLPDSSPRPLSTIRPLLWFWLLLVIGGAVAASLYWVGQNVLLVGRDSAGHLEQSVLVGRSLRSGFPQGLFQAITLDDYRPPALYLLTQLFYVLFGVSMDAAQYTNIALLAVILALTFLLARRVLSDGWALFAVLVTALLPMIAAMTRLYYMENLLTAVLLGNLIALLNARGFSRRGWSLLWGATLGLALLEKWTAPVYILAPTLVVMARTGFWRSLRTELRLRHLPWPRLAASFAVALAGGATLALLWYWPNRELVAAMEMPLGDLLPVLWALLWGALIFALWRARTVGGYFAAALLLAASAASLWYFPRADFIFRLGDVAFGTDRGTQEAWSLARLSTWTRYFQFWMTHHMGPLASLLILPPAVLGWWQARRTSARLNGTPVTVAALAWMVLSSWLLLTVLAQANARNLVPLLPPIAILLVLGLAVLRRPVAVIFAALWVAVLGMQWGIYTVNAGAALYARSPALWVHGDYTAWPASGPSDPGYWIHPQVLATVDRSTGDPVTLGMLVDTWEIHRGALRYLITRDNLNIEVMPLTESNAAGWSDLLANEYVLAKDGDNSEVKEIGRSLIAQIDVEGSLFQRLYAAERKWLLPNGDTVTLYRRSEGPPRPRDFPVVLIETSALADAINANWGPESTIAFTDADTAVWVAIHNLPAPRYLIPTQADQPVAELLEGVTGSLFMVSRYRTGEVQQWLAENGFVAGEVGSGEFRLTYAALPGAPLEELAVQPAWSEVEVVGLRSLASAAPGTVLPVELALQGRNDGSLKLSLRLVRQDGEVVAQRDVTALPAARAGLLIPGSAQPGEYTLGAVLYDPATMATLGSVHGLEFAPLSTITVRP